MAKTTELTVTEGKDEFYPTPDSLIEKMLEGIDYRMIGSVLEPSAGKGDLIKGFLHLRWKKLRYNSGNISVDAIEIDPYRLMLAAADTIEHLLERERRRKHDSERSL